MGKCTTHIAVAICMVLVLWLPLDSTEVDGPVLTHTLTTKMRLSTTAAPKASCVQFMLGPATIVGSPLLSLLLLWDGAVSIISTDDESCLQLP